MVITQGHLWYSNSTNKDMQILQRRVYLVVIGAKDICATALLEVLLELPPICTTEIC